MRASLHCVNANDLPGRCETVMGLSEDPLGTTKLGFQRADCFRASIIRAAYVPPASAVGDEVEPVIRRPFRLIDGLFKSTSDSLRVDRFSVSIESTDPEFCAVPRHVGMVPRKIGEPASVRADSRAGIEIVTLNEDFSGTTGGKIDGHNCIDL